MGNLSQVQISLHARPEHVWQDMKPILFSQMLQLHLIQKLRRQVTADTCILLGSARANKDDIHLTIRHQSTQRVPERTDHSRISNISPAFFLKIRTLSKWKLTNAISELNAKTSQSIRKEAINIPTSPVWLSIPSTSIFLNNKTQGQNFSAETKKLLRKISKMSKLEEWHKNEHTESGSELPLAKAALILASAAPATSANNS